MATNGKTNKTNTNLVNNSSGGKMIFVSDMEGCATSVFGKPQSGVVCSEDFFNELDLFLMSHPDNKVSFLGDYFDKGPQFEYTINRMIELFEKYNSQEHKKVYIILGNRDLNKLRLLFEYRIPFKYSIPTEYDINSLWKVWAPFYEKYFANLKNNRNNRNNKTSILDRFKIIFSGSMGADQGNDPSWILLSTYFDNVLSEGREERINFFKLFKYGSIAEYDPMYKVLLSHAGGIGSFLFHSEKYYEQILQAIPQFDGNLLVD